MSEPEFYANATLGFRQWYFSAAKGGDEPSALRGMANPLLHGLAKHGFDAARYRWRVDEPNHAGCARLKPDPDFLRETHGEVPGMDCSCGFYAYGRRIGANSETTIHLVGGVMVSETTIHLVGGVIAAWGNLELHERGFRCGSAKILALFDPDPEKQPADYGGGVAEKNRKALGRMCAEYGIPLLAPDALREEEEVRRYARERNLALLEDQIKEAA